MMSLTKYITKCFSLFLLLMMYGCNSKDLVSPVITPTVQPVKVVTPVEAQITVSLSPEGLTTETWTLEPSFTPSVAVTPSPTTAPKEIEVDWNALSLLRPGNYILYATKLDLHALSPDGKQDIRLIKGREDIDSMSYRSLTYDGKEIRYFDFLDIDHAHWIDLENRQEKSTSKLIQKASITGCSKGYISPSGKWIAFICQQGKVNSLVLENVDNGQILMAPHAKTGDGSPEDYLQLSWSPGEQWIAYYRSNFMLFPGPNGSAELMFVDTSCLSTPDTCPLKKTGPYALKEEKLWSQGSFTWSPDGRFFVSTRLLNQLPLLRFDTIEKTFSFIDTGSSVDFAESMSWSPDGKWIAFNHGSELYLVPSEGGVSTRIASVSGVEEDVVGWLSTYPKAVFEIGNKLFISGAGSGLNLRNSPSLNGSILEKLMTEDNIQLVDGPVVADNYHWWKVRVLKDKKEGWVVENPDWYLAAGQ